MDKVDYSKRCPLKKESISCVNHLFSFLIVPFYDVIEQTLNFKRIRGKYLYKYTSWASGCVNECEA